MAKYEDFSQAGGEYCHSTWAAMKELGGIKLVEIIH